MVGATPLISSWYHDEPTMEAANAFGFDVGTLGNHEFDEGGDELIRMLRGGQRTGLEALKRDAAGALVNTSSPDYAGASYPYIAANTVDREGELGLPPYAVVERAGVRVGFIGVTTPSTPTFLLDRHAARFRFTDISDAVNRWVSELRSRGVETIVVLAHAGGPTQDESDAPDFVGEIVDEAREMSSAVDVVIAGHSHSRLDIRVPNADGSGDKLIVEALSYGIAYDLVDLTHRQAHRRRRGEDGPGPRHAARRGRRRRSGRARRALPRAAWRRSPRRCLDARRRACTRAGGELGRVTAVAERAYAHADAAVVSPGALRADIHPGPITYAEVAEALSYGHPVVRTRMTGRELRALAAGGRFYSGPAELDPDGVYTRRGERDAAAARPAGRHRGRGIRLAPRSAERRPSAILRPCRSRSTPTSRSWARGVVGCAIARELARFELRVTLLEAGPDVGAGTSKANTALLHTGFDAKPGTLEARLVARGYELLGDYAERVGIPVERTGALLVAWNDEQVAEFPGIARARARERPHATCASVGVGRALPARAAARARARAARSRCPARRSSARSRPRSRTPPRPCSRAATCAARRPVDSVSTARRRRLPARARAGGG